MKRNYSLVILVFVVMGVFIVLISKHFTKPILSLKNTTTASTNSPAPLADNIDLKKDPIKKPTVVSNKSGYVKIQELGIEFKLPKELQDLIYIYEPKLGFAYFSTNSLLKMDPYCLPEYFPLGILQKVLKSSLTKNPDDGELYIGAVQALTKERPIPG